MTYEKFNEDFEQKVYVSSHAEYKRNFPAKYKFKVFAEMEEVSDFLRKKFIKNVMKVDEDKLPIIYLEQNIGSNSTPVFVVANSKKPKETKFAYRFKQKDDFYTIEIRVTQKNGYVVVSLFRTVRWWKTIIGVNGQMGKRDFKKKHKAESKVIEKMTKNHFEK